MEDPYQLSARGAGERHSEGIVPTVPRGRRLVVTAGGDRVVTETDTLGSLNGVAIATREPKPQLFGERKMDCYTIQLIKGGRLKVLILDI